MAIWLYNGKSAPELPEWAKDYQYVTFHSPNLSADHILAFNKVEIAHSWNITYQDWYDTYALNGVRSYRNGDSWEAPEAFSREWVLGNNPYADGSYRASWTSRDLYCAHDDGVKYLALAASNPVDYETGASIQWPPIEVPPAGVPANRFHMLIQGWQLGKRLAAMRRAEGGISVTSRLGEGVLGYMRLGE